MVCSTTTRVSVVNILILVLCMDISMKYPLKDVESFLINDIQVDLYH